MFFKTSETPFSDKEKLCPYVFKTRQTIKKQK